MPGVLGEAWRNECQRTVTLPNDDLSDDSKQKQQKIRREQQK